MAYHPFRHLGLKVVALALAALLWLTVAGEHVVERIMRVPLEFRNLPVQLEVVGDPPASVDIRLRGSSALLSRLEAGEVVAVLDLANARPGSRIFHIRNEEVRAPYGVQVTQVVPGTLGIEFEKSASRVVPVVAQIDGEPAAGFSVGQHTAEPSTVEVVGPESRVKKLASATTEPVDVAGARQNVRDVVAVGLLDSAVRLVEPQNVTVIVDVMPAPVERELRDVRVKARNIGHGLRTAEIAPAAVAVLIRGRRDLVAAVRADAIDAFVDVAGLGAGRYSLRIQSDPSQQFGVTEFSPAEVAVTLRTSK
jgi:YbbR domain-containing protein